MRRFVVFAPALFALTLFVSAFLLFLIQLMVGKLVLPLFGGAPAVWGACLVFFQAALLAGYAYAHASTAWLGARKQAVPHVVLLLAAAFVLPVAVSRAWAATGAADPVPWLLLTLLLAVGLPFFVVAATAPLLQKWFADTDHPAARDPYFLYAASNLGSMTALVAYPFLVEPNLTLAAQRVAWAAGYGVLAVLIAVCAVLLWRAPPRKDEVGRMKDEQERPKVWFILHPSSFLLPLGPAGLRPLQPSARRHHLPHHRRDRPPAAVDAAAGPLLAQLRPGLFPHPRPRRPDAPAGTARRPTVLGLRPAVARSAAPLPDAVGGAARHRLGPRPASDRVLRGLHGLSRRAGPRPARPGTPHRVLPLVVRRRGARRPVQRPRRPARLSRRRRVPAGPVAGLPAAPDARR